MALAAVATLAVSAVSAPAPAHAQRYLGAAIAGGLIGGAIVGAAVAAPYGIMDRDITGRRYGYYGGPGLYCRPRPIRRLRLAAAAFLGRLWLAIP